MEKILSIKEAKKGSDIYHLIKRVAEKVNEENPGRTNDDNWYDAQKRIIKFLLEEKIAEHLYSQNPERKYEEYLEEARKKVDSLNIEGLEKIEYEGITLEKIIECSFKYYSNYYYNMRKNNITDKNDLKKAFDDWKKAIDCVAYNVSFY